MADIPSKKSRTQLKLDLFMKSHSEQSQDTTEITSQKQTGDAGCTSSAIDATEDLEESMLGPSHLSNVQSKEDQTDLESSSISHYDIGNFIQRSSSLSYNEKIDILQNCWKPTSLLLGSSSMTSKHSKLKTEIKLFHFSQDGLISISGSTTVHMTILKVDGV